MHSIFCKCNKEGPNCPALVLYAESNPSSRLCHFTLALRRAKKKRRGSSTSFSGLFPSKSTVLWSEVYDRKAVWMSDLNSDRFLRCFFSIFSLILVSIEKIYQTLKTMNHISKNLKARKKHAATGRIQRILHSLLGVWKFGQTRSLMFDMLL